MVYRDARSSVYLLGDVLRGKRRQRLNLLALLEVRLQSLDVLLNLLPHRLLQLLKAFLHALQLLPQLSEVFGHWVADANGIDQQAQ